MSLRKEDEGVGLDDDDLGDDDDGGFGNDDTTSSCDWMRFHDEKVRLGDGWRGWSGRPRRETTNRERVFRRSERQFDFDDDLIDP